MKKNIGCLPMNNEYTFISVTDMGEDNFSSCVNCGRPIRYVVELQDAANKKYFVGTECAKTLSHAKINNEYSMNEQINAFKKIATARNLINKSNGTLKLWGYNDKSVVCIVGKSGKNPKKIYIEPIFDPFTGAKYQFIDSFLQETYKNHSVITEDYCMNDVFEYFDSLKN
jgi:hypothetical protein